MGGLFVCIKNRALLSVPPLADYHVALLVSLVARVWQSHVYTTLSITGDMSTPPQAHQWHGYHWLKNAALNQGSPKFSVGRPHSPPPVLLQAENTVSIWSIVKPTKICLHMCKNDAIPSLQCFTALLKTQHTETWFLLPAEVMLRLNSYSLRVLDRMAHMTENES